MLSWGVEFSYGHSPAHQFNHHIKAKRPMKTPTATQFLSRLNLQHPIVLAPMAGVVTPALAAAVSNAGGLGSLGFGSSTAQQALEAIKQTQALTSKPFNVNVFCHTPPQRNAAQEAAWIKHLVPLFEQVGATPPATLDETYKSFHEDEDMFNVLLAQRPAVVSFHFGLPAPHKLKALRDAGIYTMATATCVEDALQIQQAGVDAIVAQGIEAGGHRGIFNPEGNDERYSTAVLVSQLVRRTRLPVIAAGGVMNGQGIRAMLALGAAAAQLGTAFILCPESSASAAYKANLKSARAVHTRLTASLSGRPARGLVNALITHGEAAGSPAPAAYPLAYHAARQLNAAAAKLGNHEFAAHWAGQGAPLAKELPAADLVLELAKELADSDQR
jgi:nitronate monooxygenase